MKTTKDDFKFFEKEVRKWLKELGLISWDVSIFHELGIGDNEDDIAWTTYGPFTSKNATITLNTDTGKADYNRAELSRVAFHEVGHILMFSIDYLLDARFGVSKEQCAQEIHSVILTLENTLWQQCQRSKS